ncbi:hypothetical protein DVA76_18550, partial [Acinetobacter baumannii]
ISMSMKARPLCSATFLQWSEKMQAKGMDGLQFVGFGTCLPLIRVQPDWGMLKAATEFWDVYANVFRFGLQEMSPSLEEISRLCYFPLD